MKRVYKLTNDNVQNDTITLLKRWLENRNNNKTFANYLRECGYYTVVIFDAGELGRLLYDELRGTDIKVLCFYDRNAEGINSIDNIPVLPLTKLNSIPDADIILVSTNFFYPEVLRMLAEIKPEIRSLYLRDAVYEF